MKTGSGTNVWYLLVLIILAVIFIFAGVKYLGRGETGHTPDQNQNNTASTANDKPKSTSGASTELPPDQQLAAKGAEAMDKGDYATAIDYFSKAIVLDPSIASYYSLKSQAEVLAGKSADAKSTLESGLKVSPDNELLNSKLDVLNNSDNLAPTDQESPRA
ncbi:MAG: hypothetical protein WCG99_02610 [Candidatus Berkelbacteria bacterium]